MILRIVTVFVAVVMIALLYALRLPNVGGGLMLSVIIGDLSGFRRQQLTASIAFFPQCIHCDAVFFSLPCCIPFGGIGSLDALGVDQPSGAVNGQPCRGSISVG